MNFYHILPVLRWYRRKTTQSLGAATHNVFEPHNRSDLIAAVFARPLIGKWMLHWRPRWFKFVSSLFSGKQPGGLTDRCLFPRVKRLYEAREYARDAGRENTKCHSSQHTKSNLIVQAHFFNHSGLIKMTTRPPLMKVCCRIHQCLQPVGWQVLWIPAT